MNISTVNQDLPPADVDTMHPDQIAVTVIMTRVSEYFGFFVFAIACALVFPKVFFPNYDLIPATLISFSIFPLAFISRFFARFIFFPFEKRVSRAARITVAMFILGGSTIIIGFIPSYAEIGIVAPIMLCVARIGQGIGSGGVPDGLPIIMMMNAPDNKKGWYSMVPQLGGPIGFAIAASIYYVLTNYLTSEEFINWGWRFPFMVVLSLQVVALFSRLRLIDTPEYKNAADKHFLHISPVREVVKRHWPVVILGAYLPLASYALFHIVTIYLLGYIKLFPVLAIPDLLLMQTMGAILAIFTCALSGVLSDRFGRRNLLIVVTVMIGVFSFFIGSLQDSAWFFVLSGFGLLGLCFGQSGGTLPHRYEREFRFTGVALSTDLAWLFGAAFAPIIAISLTVKFGVEFAGYYLLSGVVATLIALFVARAWSRQR